MKLRATRKPAPSTVAPAACLRVVRRSAEAGVDDTVAEPTGRRSRNRWGVAELIDVAIAGVQSSSRQGLAQSRPTIGPSIISDEDMAWLLVDAVKSCLTGYERTIVFVELGSGEDYLAIKRILTTLMSTGTALPAAITSTLTGWLNGYAGSPEEPQLRMMLAVICLQQSEAVSVGGDD
jgi:hypothetical protein